MITGFVEPKVLEAILENKKHHDNLERFNLWYWKPQYIWRYTINFSIYPNLNDITIIMDDNIYHNQLKIPTGTFNGLDHMRHIWLQSPFGFDFEENSLLFLKITQRPEISIFISTVMTINEFEIANPWYTNGIFELILHDTLIDKLPEQIFAKYCIKDRIFVRFYENKINCICDEIGWVLDHPNCSYQFLDLKCHNLNDTFLFEYSKERLCQLTSSPGTTSTTTTTSTQKTTMNDNSTELPDEEDVTYLEVWKIILIVLAVMLTIVIIMIVIVKISRIRIVNIYHEYFRKRANDDVENINSTSPSTYDNLNVKDNRISKLDLKEIFSKTEATDLVYLDKIGKGSFGMVFRAMIDSTVYAVKKIHFDGMISEIFQYSLYCITPPSPACRYTVRKRL